MVVEKAEELKPVFVFPRHRSNSSQAKNNIKIDLPRIGRARSPKVYRFRQFQGQSKGEEGKSNNGTTNNFNPPTSSNIDGNGHRGNGPNSK